MESRKTLKIVFKVELFDCSAGMDTLVTLGELPYEFDSVRDAYAFIDKQNYSENYTCKVFEGYSFT